MPRHVTQPEVRCMRTRLALRLGWKSEELKWKSEELEWKSEELEWKSVEEAGDPSRPWYYTL